MFFLAGCASSLDQAYIGKPVKDEQKAKEIYNDAKKFNIKISKSEIKQIPGKPVQEALKETGIVGKSEKSRSVRDMSFPGKKDIYESDKPPPEKKGEPFFMEGYVDLKDVLDTIIVEYLESSYVMAANPSQKINIKIQGNFTKEDMLATLRIILDSVNLTLARRRGVYHIVANRVGTIMAENIQIMIFSPMYVKVINLIPILKDLKSKSGKLSTIQGSNILFMLDYPKILKRSELSSGFLMFLFLKTDMCGYIP